MSRPMRKDEDALICLVEVTLRRPGDDHAIGHTCPAATRRLLSFVHPIALPFLPRGRSCPHYARQPLRHPRPDVRRNPPPPRRKRKNSWGVHERAAAKNRAAQRTSFPAHDARKSRGRVRVLRHDDLPAGVAEPPSS